MNGRDALSASAVHPSMAEGHPVLSLSKHQDERLPIQSSTCMLSDGGGSRDLLILLPGQANDRG